ncbi:hypothetical protein LINPERPRIM_LOCUS25551, partial [Linum perenne]
RRYRPGPRRYRLNLGYFRTRDSDTGQESNHGPVSESRVEITGVGAISPRPGAIIFRKINSFEWYLFRLIVNFFYLF